MPFESLGLEAELVRAVSMRGYTKPTPIQAKAIPAILGGSDVLAGAQTGTGKTAAFTLPMLQLLKGRARKSHAPRAPRALVLTPTRELAAQVGDSVKTYGRNTKLTSTIVFGGVGINPQKDKLRRGVDVLVATPGRLLDHAGQRTVDLSKVEMLVLDEADRMLDMGFMPDIKRILKLLPEERQNMLFSATYTDEIRRLADGLLNNPEMIEVASRNTAAELVSQVVHPVERTRKRALLSHLIKDGDWTQALVFTRTKHGANKLSKQLATDGIRATAIHGNKSQAARTQALSDFKRGRVKVLVATDVAARGLDIEKLPHVVNFDLPQVAEDYVHRIGRTGRAGTEGRAVSFVSADERYFLMSIEKLLKRSIDVEKIDGFQMDNSDDTGPPTRNWGKRGGGGGGARGSRSAKPGRSQNSGRPGGPKKGNRKYGSTKSASGSGPSFGKGGPRRKSKDSSGGAKSARRASR